MKHSAQRCSQRFGLSRRKRSFGLMASIMRGT
jgi:hypothetical protein